MPSEYTQTRNVLCVDDEPMIVRMFKKVLVSHLPDYYKIITASSGQEALDIMHGRTENKIDGLYALITDLKMPYMNGLELYQEMLNYQKQLPGIMLTGRPDENVTKQFEILGGIVLLKPLGIKEIPSILENLAINHSEN